MVFIFSFFSFFYFYYTTDYFKNAIMEIKIEQYEYFTQKNCDGVEGARSIGNALFIEEYTFKKGNSLCVKKLLESKDTLIIKKSLGGLLFESFYLSNFIDENEITVKILDTCISACVLLLSSSTDALVCENANIGIHQLTNKNKKLDWFYKEIFSGYADPYNSYNYFLLEKYGVDTDFHRRRIAFFDGLESYRLSNEELIIRGYASEIIACK